MQLHIPQPMNPQLNTWTITGMSERLNNFRGERGHPGKISLFPPGGDTPGGLLLISLLVFLENREAGKYEYLITIFYYNQI